MSNSFNFGTTHTLMHALSDAGHPRQDEARRWFRRTYSTLLLHWLDRAVPENDSANSSESENDANQSRSMKNRCGVCGVAHPRSPRGFELLTHVNHDVTPGADDRATFVEPIVEDVLEHVAGGHVSVDRQSGSFRKYLLAVFNNAAIDFVRLNRPKVFTAWTRRHLPYEEIIPAIQRAMSAGASWQDERKALRSAIEEWLHRIGIANSMCDALCWKIVALIHKTLTQENDKSSHGTRSADSTETCRDILRRCIRNLEHRIEQPLDDLFGPITPEAEIHYVLRTQSLKESLIRLALFKLLTGLDHEKRWGEALLASIENQVDQFCKRESLEKGAFHRLTHRARQGSIPLLTQAFRVLQHLDENSPEIIHSLGELKSERELSELVLTGIMRDGETIEQVIAATDLLEHEVLNAWLLGLERVRLFLDSQLLGRKLAAADQIKRRRIAAEITERQNGFGIKVLSWVENRTKWLDVLGSAEPDSTETAIHCRRILDLLDSHLGDVIRDHTPDFNAEDFL